MCFFFFLSINSFLHEAFTQLISLPPRPNLVIQRVKVFAGVDEERRQATGAAGLALLELAYQQNELGKLKDWT